MMGGKIIKAKGKNAQRLPRNPGRKTEKVQNNCRPSKTTPTLDSYHFAIHYFAIPSFLGT